MAKTTRVHNLAKELGVKSKAIVEKCQAEGLDIKNHMSTISVGLAATIREWFSEGEHTTTVEHAGRVDLKEVRVEKPKAAPPVTEPEVVAEPEKPTETETAPEEAAPTEEAPAEPEAAPTAEEVEEPDQAEEAPAEPTETEPAPAAEAPAEPKAEEKPAPEKKAPKKPKIKMHEPPKPEPVKPAGPMLSKPKPAKLSGPRVIRVEKPEPERKRRRKPGRPSKPRYDQPVTEPLMPSQPQPVKGKKSKKRGKGTPAETPEEQMRRKKQKRMRARDMADRQARLAAASGAGSRVKPSRKIETRKKTEEERQAERPDHATVSEPITVKDLSAAIAVKTGDVIAKLMAQGVMATANQTISTEVAQLVSMDFGTELSVERKHSAQELIEKQFEEREKKNVTRRPPVVTMLGHVDHGKTSLLDKIRSTSVASGEAGGITQHIGASQIVWNGKKITFLDTPGHEAFTAMRARGANMTDIVVLVVAADDGLMPQTIEAIHHAKAADVEIIVALNKIDLPGTDVNKVYGQLAEHGLTPAEWSGDTEVVKTSAISGEGIEDLIEHLDIIAELKDYQADNKIPATGWVIESKMSHGQGPVATLLVKEGQLKKGDVVLAGNGYGRVRTLKDSYGKNIKVATPSYAVEVSGLSEVPTAGDRFFCLEDINQAKNAAEQNLELEREKTLSQRSQVTLDNLFTQIEAGNIKELNLILKADVQGSVDVLIKYLSELSTDEVKINILHAAVGGITEGDVVLAEASEAIIIGFNVVADEKTRSIAESKGVDIRLYSIIYRITEDLKDAMVGMLEPEYEEKVLGTLIVRDTFRHSRIGTIAGCFVKSGVITKNSKVRLIRNNIVIRDKCSIDSLKHFRDDVREVKAGLECGVKIANFDDVKVDDVLESFEVVEVKREL
ncbi:Translation initiation factor IF-2 [Anaerohalosphaera lusitana]|uniref:Translation initiation factor IF-2 n=1 Tax=Anaerohalosphaera lusitana TaxID=1936003 RepID=A0A1U9NJH3_9BACT|nr:translation initiation factor IF-2 [Anaerohalosphaera lusitana]AQT67666.1 Translation initiation factor IF-2 [Anaerohalosphaera lusitana]